MKPSALALLVTVLLTACASSELEQRAAAERAVAQRDQEARRAASAAATASTAAAPAPADAMPPVVAPTEQHAWLQQLVGEWSFTCKATMQEGEQPFEMKGTESVRPLGGLWVVAQGHATVGGQPLQSQMSLGYDPETKAFVGTWLDSSQTHLWSYKGALDDGKTTLTLDTEGPSFDDPSKTSHYRDAIELKDKDHKALTSSVQMPDGTWMTFMRAEYVRKR